MDAFVNVPQAFPLQPPPAMLQETPWPLGSLKTLAVNVTVCPASIDCCVAGDIATEGWGVVRLVETAPLEPPPQLVRSRIHTATRCVEYFRMTCYPLQNSQASRSIRNWAEAEYRCLAHTVNIDATTLIGIDRTVTVPLSGPQAATGPQPRSDGTRPSANHLGKGHRANSLVDSLFIRL
jgi:hypothetical protein